MAGSLGPVALMLVLLVGVVFAVLAWRWPFASLAGFLLLLLVHEAGLRILQGPVGLAASQVAVVSLWRMAALLALLLVLCVRTAMEWRRERRRPQPEVVDYILLALGILGAMATVLSPNRLAGLAAYRNYFQPVAIFFLARMASPTRGQLRSLLIAWLALGVIMAAFGTYQWLSWSKEDYRRNGYVLATGELDIARVRGEDGEIRVRPPSTVSGPNEFGLHMAFLFLGAVQWAWLARGKRRCLLALLAVLFAFGLAYSYSRSALLALLAGLACLVVFAVSAEGREGMRRRLLRPRSLVLVAALSVTLLAVMWSSGMMRRVARTVQQLPQEYHVQDTLGAIDFLVAHPLGPGMGLVGPREGAYFPKIKEYHVEGTLFQLAMDMSVVGLLMWLALWWVALRRVWSAWRSARDPLLRLFNGLVFSAWIAALLTFLILPLMQSFSLMGWLWFFLGLSYTSQDVQRAWDGADARPRMAHDLALAVAG